MCSCVVNVHRRAVSTVRATVRVGAWLAACLSSLIAHASDGGIALDRDTALRASQAAIGRTLDDYAFTDKHGATRRLSEFRGKPVAVSLIFTSCYGICPATTQQLRRVVEEGRSALGAKSFKVLSIGFDTQRDTPQAMAEYARTQRIDSSEWEFLSADAATIDSLTSQLGFVYTSAAGGFDHVIQTTIVDGKGVVYRQVYGNEFKTPQFVEPLKELAYGLKPEQSAFEALENRIRLFCTVYDPATGSYKFSYAIFVGFGFGVVAGSLFIFLLIREWRSHLKAAKASSP